MHTHEGTVCWHQNMLIITQFSANGSDGFANFCELFDPSRVSIPPPKKARRESSNKRGWACAWGYFCWRYAILRLAPTKKGLVIAGKGRRSAGGAPDILRGPIQSCSTSSRYNPATTPIYKNLTPAKCTVATGLMVAGHII